MRCKLCHRIVEGGTLGTLWASLVDWVVQQGGLWWWVLPTGALTVWLQRLRRFRLLIEFSADKRKGYWSSRDS